MNEIKAKENREKKQNWSLLNRKGEIVGEVAGSCPEWKDPAPPVTAYQTSYVGSNDRLEVRHKEGNRCRLDEAVEEAGWCTHEV